MCVCVCLSVCDLLWVFVSVSVYYFLAIECYFIEILSNETDGLLLKNIKENIHEKKKQSNKLGNNINLECCF